MRTAAALAAGMVLWLAHASLAHGQSTDADPGPQSPAAGTEAPAEKAAPPASATGTEVPAEKAALPPAGALDKPPRLLRFVEAAAPPALASRESADVTLLIDVNEAGQVTSAQVQTAAGDGFDEAAVAAARQFVFAPGESGGKPVPVRITYRYHFLLKPPPAAPAPPPAPGSASRSAQPARPTAPLAGAVRRKGDRAALAGVSVILDEAEQEAVTDSEGRFAFPAVTIGSHVLKLRGSDISAVDTKVQLNPGKSLELSLYVQAKERYVSTVRGEKLVVETLEQTLARDEIKKIPGTNGDTLKAVQNLPGVARAPFGLGLLVVWGSAPQDTRTYVDGVFIPTLYHFGGLRSTVNSEMVQSLTFTPGAFGAERGLGLGGVVEVATRTPRRDGYHGYVQLDIIDGSFLLEGPIGKQLSFAVALRRSWIDAFLPLFFRGGGFQISPSYWDYQARLTYRPTARDELGLFVFGSDDQLGIYSHTDNPAVTQDFSSHTYYVRTVASWLHRFAQGATLSVIGSVGYDAPSQSRSQSPTSTITSDAHLLSYTLRATTRVPLTGWLRLDGGLDFEGNFYSLEQARDTEGIAPASRTFSLYTHHLGPWVSAELSLLDRKLTITPQLRLQLFTFLGYPGESMQFSSAFVEPDPRIRLRYQALPWLALKAGFGLYHQAPPSQRLSPYTGNPELAPESALHYVLGVEFLPMAKLHISLDGFYKDLRDLVVRGKYANDPLYVNDGTGVVYGGELLVRLDLWKNLFGWVSYTLSRSERQDHPSDESRIFEYDQTHILALIASYKLPLGFQVGLRFRYVSGNPTTPVLGAAYDSNQDRYIPISGPLNSDRLAAFNQLDVRIDKTFTFDRWQLSLYLDVQNVYYQSNPEGIVYNFNYTQASPLNGLPILPALGIRGDF